MCEVKFWRLLLAGGCGVSAAVVGLLKDHEEPLVGGAALAAIAYAAAMGGYR